MTTNLIPLPRRWLAEQINRSDAITHIRSDVARLVTQAGDLREELAGIRAELAEMTVAIRGLATIPADPDIPLPDCTCHTGCSCGVGHAANCPAGFEAMLTQLEHQP